MLVFLLKSKHTYSTLTNMFMIFRVLILSKFILGFLNSLIASSDPDPKHYSSKEKVRDIAISQIAKSFFYLLLGL